MHNIVKLPIQNLPRRYAMMKIKGVSQLACLVNGEWIIDATCKSINEMLEVGLVCEESVTGWLNGQNTTSH